jgi:hypothetical protein
MSANWRHVMRTLGLNASSAGAIRIVRRRADNLGLDTSHFRGKRAWSDAQLRRAVMDAQSWDELLTTLGLAPRSGNGKVRVKAHAMRMGLELAHLENPVANVPGLSEVKPDLRYLRDAATTIAASWFSLCGLSVALPVEPAIYDLLVTMPDEVKRVQVKTTTRYSKDDWTVVVGRRPYSTGNQERLLPYDPELIDWFFIVDGDLAIYLVPSRVIAGRVAILLRAYGKYIVGNASGLMASKAA